jgi:tetratricopeptide (TPR) repeat protein
MALTKASCGMLLLLIVACAAESPKFNDGLALYKAGNCHKALEQLAASENAGEPGADRPLYQGICEAKLGDWAAAAGYLTQYTASHPADVRGWYWLSQSHLYSRRFDHAEKDIQRAIELDPNSALGYRTLGEIELELKNHDAAYRAWLKANQLDPGNAQTTYYLGRMFFEAEFWDEAAAWLRQALKADPHHFAAMTYLGMCAERLDMEKTAFDLYAAAIRESKEQKKPYSWAFLSYAKLLRTSGKEQLAIATLDEAEHLCPEAHVLTALGQMLSATDPERATALLRRAIAIDSSIPDAHYRLALLLAKAGQPAEAHAEMQRFQEAKAAAERNKPNIQAIRR